MSDNNTYNENSGHIIPIDIEKEVKTSYLTYAMSVIVSRALPDARDGLKPVHRRILYTMFESGLHHNGTTRKCARIVGGVISNYHPHGPDSIYNALARLSQSFSMRYPLIIGQGNFGSIDGDPPAAYRYTEAKLSQISEELLADIRKDTVDFIPNFDESTKEPTVLPSVLPFLLLNGSTGIAVGLTTEVPPHNIHELAEAVIQQIDNPDISIDELCDIVKGPDFPTGGIIMGTNGIKKAYKTGRGIITIQSRHTLEHSKGYDQIIFTDTPYAKRKSEMITRLASLVNNEVITGIRDIRDVSNRKGIRIIVELKKDSNVQLILQKIFALTDFQSNYSINITALVDQTPLTLGLKQCLTIFIDHRKKVIVRKTRYELQEAEKRAHILRGLLVALNNIEEVIELIKNSKDTNEAHQKLVATFSLDDEQTKAILDMRLARLTSLEIKKLVEELEKLEVLIIDLKDILNQPERVKEIIKETIRTLSKKYASERKTDIQNGLAVTLSEEELINEEGMMVTLTQSGYIKRTNITNFGVQNRGGKGKLGVNLIKDDSLDKIYVGSTHDTMLFISSLGRGFAIKTYQIPEATRTSRGISIRILFPLQQDEKITSILAAPDFNKNSSLIIITHKGKIKKLIGEQLKGTTTKRGLRLLTLGENDFVADSNIITNKDDIFIFSSTGKVLRLHTNSIRSMGRTASGVIGLKLKNDAYITSVLIGNDNSIFTLISERGYAKRIKAKDITIHGRGTSGIIVMSISPTSGILRVALKTQEEDNISAISQQGKTIRFNVNTCAIQGRNSRGVMIFTLDNNDIITGAVVSNDIE